MVTVLVAIVVIAAIYTGLTYHLQSGRAFVIGVATTLGLWGAPFVLPPSYGSVLYLLLGFLGSVFFGLIGAATWWRARARVDIRSWLWLVGGAVAIGPAVVLSGYQLFR